MAPMATPLMLKTMLAASAASTVVGTASGIKANKEAYKDQHAEIMRNKAMMNEQVLHQTFAEFGKHTAVAGASGTAGIGSARHANVSLRAGQEQIKQNIAIAKGQSSAAHNKATSANQAAFAKGLGQLAQTGLTAAQLANKGLLTKQ